MQYTLSMGVGQRVCEAIPNHTDHLGRYYADDVHQLRESLAAYKLGNNVAFFGGGAGIVKDLKYVVVSELLDSTRLPGESLSVTRRRRQVRVKNFYCNLAIKCRMSTTIDGCHSAFTHFLQDLVFI
jgi:hypothetical protein